MKAQKIPGLSKNDQTKLQSALHIASIGGLGKLTRLWKRLRRKVNPDNIDNLVIEAIVNFDQGTCGRYSKLVGRALNTIYDNQNR